MKKLLLFVIIFICTNAIANDGKTGPGVYRPRTEIQISDATDPSYPSQIRSLLGVCEVWADFQMECVEVEVYKYIGKATITITDACGRVVACEQIDTATEPFTMLTMPTADGMYTIKITGTNYIGIGNFTIM